MTTRRQASSVALEQAARSLRLALILHGAVRWAVLSGGGLLALLVLDEVLHLPQGLRLPLAVVLVGFVLVDFYRRVWRPIRRPLSPARAARLLEMERNIAGNLLINAHHFQRQQVEANWKPFVGSILASSSSALGNIPGGSLWLTAPLKKWFLGLLAIAVCWVLIVFAFPRYVTTGMERIFLPLADIPPVGSWTIRVTPASRVRVVEGDRLDITATLKSQLGLSGKPPIPHVVWQDGSASADSAAGAHAAMVATTRPNEFAFSFSAVSQPFRFHIVDDDSRSASVEVEVSPLPQLKGSIFEVTPPAYTGLKPFTQPGPPEALEIPAGSTVKARIELSPHSPGVLWRTDKETIPLVAQGAGWELTRIVDDSANYDLLTALAGKEKPRVLGHGQLTAVPDRAPEVDFVTTNRNVATNPGDTLPVTVKATDDYGVASITLRIAASDDAANARVLKAWNYLGPPGQKEPSPEKYTVTLDPSVFTPGSTYLLTAQAADFSPAGQKTTSRPIVIRVAGVQDMTVPVGDALEKLFEILRNTIAAQTRANGLTDNLHLHLAEALAAKDLPQHFSGMTDMQRQTQDLGISALTEAGAHDEGKPYLGRLTSLVRGEMGLALGQIDDVAKKGSDDLDASLGALHKRQAYILNELISLLGQMARDRQQSAEALAKKTPDATTPPLTTNEEISKLKDQLKAFAADQKRIIAASKSLHALNPEDLTSDQQQVLGQLARAEAKQAAFFQEKLTDLSKLPLQDFGDGKVVSDMNAVYQEVQKASEALYQKRVEIAVPGETAGLEKAESIEQNLERWLPNTPDNTKWSMEEPAASHNDVPMAELPKQLDDMIGDLLNKEQQMDPDKDDVSSSIMDSMDKGAGWGADDGPMSNMSAKGVTGNQLPNNDEIGGRSGEGRNGKSDGEMVGNTAVGKGGMNTPTRMTSTPFENGSVADQSKDSGGGATGGGKLSGFGQDGLRGPMPPAAQQRVRMLMQQQAKLKQQAESLALQLRKQRRPTGDLESAVAAMNQMETAAKNQNGLGLVQGYHQALDALTAARSAYAGDRLSRVESDALARTAQPGVSDAQAEQAPAGYEEMTGAYFRSLGDSSSQTTQAQSAAPTSPATSAPAAASSTPAPSAIPTTSPASNPPAKSP